MGEIDEGSASADWGAVRGRAVQVGEGKPLPGVAIGWHGHTIFTSSDGVYCLEVPAKGWMRISGHFGLGDYGTPGSTVNVTVGRFAELDFRVDGVLHVPEAGYVEGSVLDSATGASLAGAEIVLMNAGAYEPAPLAITMQDGRFGNFVSDSIRGDYPLMARAAGFREKNTTVHFDGTMNQHVELEIRLERDPQAATAPGTLCGQASAGRSAETTSVSLALAAIATGSIAGMIGFLAGRRRRAGGTRSQKSEPDSASSRGSERRDRSV